MRTRVMEKVPLLTLSAVAARLSSGRNMQTVSVNDPLTPTYISPLKKKKNLVPTWRRNHFLLFHLCGFPIMMEMIKSRPFSFPCTLGYSQGRRARSEDRCEFEGYCIY